MHRSRAPHWGIHRAPRQAALRVLLGAAMALLLFTATTAPAEAAQSRTNPTAAPPLTISAVAMWADTWSYNPWASGYATWPLTWLVTLPLGVNIPPNPNKFSPVLASGWRVQGSTITVTMRRNAHWQNGAPVTSEDALTTLLVDGTEGAGGVVWPYVTSVTAPSSHTLSVHVKKGFSTYNVLDQLLAIYPVPTKEYGVYLNGGPATIEHEILLENQTTNSSLSVREAKLLSPIFKRIADYHPKAAIGNGPFRLVSQTTEEAKLTKWNGFYASDKVHVPSIDALNFAEAGSIVALQGEGGIDYTWENLSDLLLIKHFLSAKGNRIHSEPELTTESYFFDPYRYPFTLKQVRQAIAYVVNLPKLDYLGRGSAPGLSAKSIWHPKKYIDGLNFLNEEGYLDSSTKSQLNQYPYNPAKATRLLDSVGFHKVGGKWYMPNGKPFSIAVYLWAGRPTPSGLEISPALKRFGIAASTVALPSAEVISQLETGSQNSVAFTFGAFGVNPLASLLGMAGTVTPPTAQTPLETVPGVGKVNVVQALTKEQATVNPGPEMHRLVNSWARYFNQQADFLTYSDYVYLYQFNTNTYSWPPASSSLWKIGYHLRLLFWFMTHGYLKPVR